MCAYEIIVKGEGGFVVRCRDCGAINVVFGNTAISVYKPEFLDLQECIREKVRTHRSGHRPKVREIYVDTPLPGYKMLFSFEELQAFSQLLIKAKLILDVRPSVN
jgi:hypothetical protein